MLQSIYIFKQLYKVYTRAVIESIHSLPSVTLTNMYLLHLENDQFITMLSQYTASYQWHNYSLSTYSSNYLVQSMRITVLKTLIWTERDKFYITSTHHGMSATPEHKNPHDITQCTDLLEGLTPQTGYIKLVDKLSLLTQQTFIHLILTWMYVFCRKVNTVACCKTQDFKYLEYLYIPKNKTFYIRLPRPLNFSMSTDCIWFSITCTVKS